MMSVFLDFFKYRDGTGLNQLKSTGEYGLPSDNGALFTMEYLICLLDDEKTPFIVKHKEVERLKDVYRSLEVKPGVSVRNIGHSTFDSMDNVNAILTFSALHDNGEFAKRTLRHGQCTFAKGIDETQDALRNHKYYWIANLLNFFRGPKNYWNNQNVELFCFFSWFGRSPGFMAYMRMCAGVWRPFDWFTVLISQFLGLRRPISDTDARKLPYVAWQYLKTKNWLWNKAYRLWTRLLMKQYPNGMKDVYARYYPKEHPISSLSKPYI